jgi:polar amino acid transport system substrate-binding protein
MIITVGGIMPNSLVRASSAKLRALRAAKLLSLITLSFLFVAPSAWAKSINITCLNWTPYIDIDSEGYGVATEIVRNAFSIAGISISVHFMPWKRGISKVQNGEIEANYCAWYGEERNRDFMFSRPYLVNKIVFVKQRNRLISWKSLKDLQDFTFAVIDTAVYSEEFDNASYLDKYSVSGPGQGIQMVSSGRVDLAPMDAGHALDWISKNKSVLPKLVDLVEKPLSENPLHIIVSRNLKNHREIIEAFNKGLAASMQDGTYDRILKKHGMSDLRAE